MGGLIVCNYYFFPMAPSQGKIIYILGRDLFVCVLMVKEGTDFKPWMYTISRLERPGTAFLLPSLSLSSPVCYFRPGILQVNMEPIGNSGVRFLCKPAI